MIIDFKKIIFLFFISIGFYFFYTEYKILISSKYNFNYEISNKILIKKQNKIIENKIKNPKKENVETSNDELFQKEITINKGDTFYSILKENNLSDKKIYKIINKVSNFFDLKKLRINDKIKFQKDLNENIKKIIVSIDIDSILVINIEKDINIEKKKLEKISFEVANEFEIFESLYSDGIKNNLPGDILVKLIKLFSFDLDFQRDIRKNTKVSVSYELNQIKDSNKLEYKDINYALISIDGKDLEYFKFKTSDGYVDYFNRDGKNVKKSLLKTPLDGARISSNYGMRKHPISGFNKMHKGVDFAAPTGTPVYAGGNGIIEYVGNNGGYGKYIRIRHNNEYKTAYAHLSKYKNGIAKGVRVNQGDIIGYVGNTGNSTGPHLHYEIIFQNKHINPLKLKLPSGKILSGEELERFKKEYIKIYANHLNLLYE